MAALIIIHFFFIPRQILEFPTGGDWYPLLTRARQIAALFIVTLFNPRQLPDYNPRVSNRRELAPPFDPSSKSAL